MMHTIYDDPDRYQVYWETIRLGSPALKLHGKICCHAAPALTSDPKARLHTSPGQTAKLCYMGLGRQSSLMQPPPPPPESVFLSTTFVSLNSPLFSFTLT